MALCIFLFSVEVAEREFYGGVGAVFGQARHA